MFGSRARISVLENQLAASDQILAAIGRSQATIEFALDGTILTANDNFLKTMGYSLPEIAGKHHRIFATPAHAGSPEYRSFWADLNAGRFVAGKFERVDRQGRTVWLQASYNPVLDAQGRPIKIIKLAVNVTEAELASQRAEAEKLESSDAQSHATTVLAKALARLAQGDLTARVTEPVAPAFARIREDFNTAMGELQSAMQSVNIATSALQSGASEIASASDDLSRRTEQQAASLEETAAALDEITTTVARSSEGVRRVALTMSEARTDATESGNVVQSAVLAMGEIEASSRQISQIVGVIDEIAFQTNLLALNAGVEAARAGDAGRGFAVVASEVRSLAQRCADAAREIKGLIHASSSQVDQGVKLVGATGASLQRIVGKIAEMDGLVTEIATSSREQATGLAEVNAAVNQMDQVTQQNAAMVEQSTAAAASLQAEASALVRQVARFDTGTGGTPQVRPVEAARSARPRPAGNPVGRLQSQVSRSVGATARDLNQWDEF